MLVKPAYFKGFEEPLINFYSFLISNRSLNRTLSSINFNEFLVFHAMQWSWTLAIVSRILLSFDCSSIRFSASGFMLCCLYFSMMYRTPQNIRLMLAICETLQGTYIVSYFPVKTGSSGRVKCPLVQNKVIGSANGDLDWGSISFLFIGCSARIKKSILSISAALQSSLTPLIYWWFS